MIRNILATLDLAAAVRRWQHSFAQAWSVPSLPLPFREGLGVGSESGALYGIRTIRAARERRRPHAWVVYCSKLGITDDIDGLWRPLTFSDRTAAEAWARESIGAGALDWFEVVEISVAERARTFKRVKVDASVRALPPLCDLAIPLEVPAHV